MSVPPADDDRHARLRRVALIVAAHGSTRRTEAAAHVEAVAAAVRAARAFASVSTAYILGEPNGATDIGDAQEAVVVPLMMSDGQLAEAIVERVRGGLRDRQVPILVAEPIGMRPETAELAARMAERTLRGHGWRDADTNIVLVAHGSGSRPESKRNGERHAASIRAMHRFRSVRLALLEEAPTIADALASVDGPAVVVGLFSAPGGHAMEDVPKAIAATGKGDAVYAGPVGADAGIAGLVTACARAALAAET